MLNCHFCDRTFLTKPDCCNSKRVTKVIRCVKVKCWSHNKDSRPQCYTSIRYEISRVIDSLHTFFPLGVYEGSLLTALPPKLKHTSWNTKPSFKTYPEQLILFAKSNVWLDPFYFTLSSPTVFMKDTKKTIHTYLKRKAEYSMNVAPDDVLNRL